MLGMLQPGFVIMVDPLVSIIVSLFKLVREIHSLGLFKVILIFFHTKIRARVHAVIYLSGGSLNPFEGVVINAISSSRTFGNLFLKFSVWSINLSTHSKLVLKNKLWSVLKPCGCIENFHAWINNVDMDIDCTSNWFSLCCYWTTWYRHITGSKRSGTTKLPGVFKSLFYWNY